jgi:hypothetical protein
MSTVHLRKGDANVVEVIFDGLCPEGVSSQFWEESHGGQRRARAPRYRRREDQFPRQLDYSWPAAAQAGIGLRLVGRLCNQSR